MANRQQTPGIQIKSQADAEKALGIIAEHTHQRTLLQAKLNEQFTAARERYEPMIEIHANTIKGLEEKLDAWARAGGADFPDGRKSLDVLHGTIGLRTGPPKLALRARMTWEKVIENLGVKRFMRFIRTKQEVDKAAILAAALDQANPLAEGELADMGVKVVQEEGFYYELKQQ